MTIDEAIKHCEKVAERQEYLSKQDHGYCEEKWNVQKRAECAECAADHRQLAEWLTEWKELKELREQKAEYKRLLKSAVEGFKFLGAWMDERGDCTLDCTDCPLHRAGINCRCWNKQDEALALIGEDIKVNTREDGEKND